MPSVRDLYRKQTTQIATASLEPLALPHIATPSDPGAGNTAIYAKSDGKLYTLPAGGAETEVGSGGSGGREVLTANRTYYVRTDGSDSNDGLSNTAGGAFATIQKAIDVVAGLDTSIYDATIQLSNGTYDGSIVLKRPIGAGIVTIQGDNVNPSNVIITSSTATTISAVAQEGIFRILGCKITNTLTAFCAGIQAENSYIEFGNIDFGGGGSVNYQQIYALNGGRIKAVDNYSISGGAQSHILSAFSGNFAANSRTITLIGTPAFSAGFARALNLGEVDFRSCTFSGSATGVRYVADCNGYIRPSSNSLTALPGNTAGTTTNGGQYIYN